MAMPSKKWSDIAAEEDDLQSVTAGTASSTLPSTVMSDGEASENETQQSDVSRLSKWRPSSSKSSGKKEKQRKKMMEYLKKKAEQQGETFTPLDKDTYKSKQSTEMVFALTPVEVRTATEAGGIVLPRSEASFLTPQAQIHCIMRSAEVNKLDLEERMELKRERDSFFEPKFIPRPQSHASIDHVTKRYTIMKDGWQWCIMCSKWATAEHNSSTIHVERTHEMAATDEMIGSCRSLRRWEPTPGLTGELTQTRFKDYWGDEVENMPQLLRNRLLAGAKIVVSLPHLGKKATKEIALDSIKGIGFAAVSYPGTGKYSLDFDGERAVYWGDLLGDYDDALPLSDMPNKERLIDEKNDAMNRKSMTLSERIPPGSGWWPACIVTWDTQHLDHGFTSYEGYYTAVVNGQLCVYAVCWYQLMDGTILITAWPIRLMARL